MHSMLLLGGSGGMPPQENLKNRCSEIASESIFVNLLARLYSYVFRGTW